MKMINTTLLFVFLVCSFTSLKADYTQHSLYTYNFEGAGWVTEIIVPLYKNWITPPSLNNYRLYARSDVGGVYISYNNGESWEQLQLYRTTDGGAKVISASELCVQGLAVHPENPDIIFAACGNELVDAYSYIFKNIIYSLDGGTTWNVPTSMNGDGIIFKGNNNVNSGYEKLGGECIAFSPNKVGNFYPIYAGGAPVPDNLTFPYPNQSFKYSRLYKSSNGGSTWNYIESYPLNYDTITSIAMKEGSAHIWVGTSKGIYVSSNNGNNWSSFTIGDKFHHVKRIVLSGDDVNGITAFVTAGMLETNNQSDYGLWKIPYSSPFIPVDITGNFDNGIQNDQKTTHFSTLVFPRNTTTGILDYNHLIAGRYGRPIRESHGNPPGGNNTWGGFNNNQIIFRYPESGGYNLPGHQYPSSAPFNESYIFTGLNNLTQNPIHPSCWYASGGAGAYKSENVNIEDNNTSFSNSRWKYIVNGITMPVANDVNFLHSLSEVNYFVSFPIMDWILGQRTRQGNWMEPLAYDRRQIFGQSGLGNFYITNATRCLQNPQQDLKYMNFVIGGYQFDNSYNHLKAAFYRRDLQLDGSYNITPEYGYGGPAILTDNNRYITDGIIFRTNTSSPANRIIVSVGQSNAKTQPNSQNGGSIGIFKTDNGGGIFSKCNFDGQSRQSITTEERYQQSLISGNYSNSILSQQSVNQFNLANGSNGKVYLYLENGGVFMSTNNGDNFSYQGAPSVSYLDEGTLKYTSQGGGKLYLVIKGNPLPNNLNEGGYNPRAGGFFVSTDDGENWSAMNNGEWSQTTYCDVIQMDIDASGQKIAVFGKKGSDKHREIYISTNSGSNFEKLSSKLEPFKFIPNVRSLRIAPFPYDNELWIATSGQGVLKYRLFFSNSPVIISNDVKFNSDYCSGSDVEILTGGSLTISDNINFSMSQGMKIIVNEGGKLNINGVTFNSLDSSQQWGGIEVENCDSSLTIQNCTFNNATLPIKIINDETTAYSEKIIKNNVFNCESTQDFAVYAENVFNILIQGNQFNMAGEGSQTVGLEVKNNGDYICEETTPKINIVNNTFTDGCASMVLNSYASELTPVYVYGNTFSGSSATYNIIGRMITGTIKNNNFSGTGTDNPVYLQQCTPDMFRNVINGTGTTMILNGHSYPNLSPVRTSNTYYWYGGQNKLYSSNAGNINVIDAGLPFINYGHNQFSKNSDPLYFHIAGALDSTVETYNAAKNAWCSSGDNPVNYLYTTGNPYVITDFSEYLTCNQLPAVQYTGSVITDMGFGINDTLFISSHTNNYIPPDEILYSQASVYASGGQYLDAINSYKFLINNHTVSDYLNTSLYDMFDCYQNIDTSENTTYRDNLYSDLITYLNEKIQSNNYNSEFIDIANYLINMCKASIENYNDALTGFEFIAMFHPDATMRLLASWDYNEVLELMGQSGAEKEMNKEQFRKKVLSEIENTMKNDSTMRVVSRMFKQQNEDIDNTYANKTTTSKSGNENTGKIKTNNESKKDNASKEYGKRQKINLISKEVREDLIQKAEENLRTLRTMNSEKKIKKHKEDILLIAGLTAATEKKIETTSLPLSYSLSQNYPNPFNPVTKINYELPNDGKVKLMIYDVLGREIKTLVNEVKQAGKYTVEFNGHNFASGVYFYRIESGKFTDVKRMVLVK